MATVFFIVRNEALDALDEALEPSPEKISAPTLLNAAEYIKIHCESQKGCCDDCCFYKEYGNDGNSNKACRVFLPENWDI